MPFKSAEAERVYRKARYDKDPAFRAKVKANVKRYKARSHLRVHTRT
jgi:hypothetical protein